MSDQTSPLPAEEGGRPIYCRECGGDASGTEDGVPFNEHCHAAWAHPLIEQVARRDAASVVSSEEGGRGTWDCARCGSTHSQTEDRICRMCGYRQSPAFVVGDASEGEALDLSDDSVVLYPASRIVASLSASGAIAVVDDATREELWSAVKLALTALRSTRAALEATKDEFVQYRDEQDTRLREAQKDARQARAALEEAREDAEHLRKYAEHAPSCPQHDPWKTHRPCNCGLAAIPSQESTKV